MACESETFTMSVVIDRFPVSFEEIIEVSKFISETAKSMGCHYSGVDIDIVTDDDTRVQWESKR